MNLIMNTKQTVSRLIFSITLSFLILSSASLALTPPPAQKREIRIGIIMDAEKHTGTVAADIDALREELVSLLGFEVPLWVFIPNLHFELTIGLWVLIKGASASHENQK